MNASPDVMSTVELPKNTGNAYMLPVPDSASQRLSAGWLWLSFAALVGAGLFALIVVLARTPYISGLFPTVDFFKSALVVHVDLSVLLWFFAFAGVLWAAASPPKLLALGKAALLLAVTGVLVVVISPFVGTGGPLMNNYVPVLENKWFLAGLFLFAAGIALQVFRGMLTIPLAGLDANGTGRVLCLGLYFAVLATAMALIAFAWAFATIPHFVTGLPYYEALFWGGGHVMQFVYTLLMMVGWLWLATECGAKVPLTPRVSVVMFALGLAPVLITPVIYLMNDADSGTNMYMFTQMMRVGGSLAVIPVGLAVIVALWKRGYPDPAVRPFFASLVCSLVLFGVGGGISLMIRDSNTIITAHYHGTGGAVSLAFMGMALLLLPKLGFRKPDLKLASLMPYVYGVGQLLHIIGLLWSGGYGVQRKVAGADQALNTVGQKIGMGVMGFGGLIAVVGGLMFLVIVFRAMKGRKA